MIDPHATAENACSSSSTPTPDHPRRPVWSGFLRSAERFSTRPALQAKGRTLSYEELSHTARRLAATLQAHSPASAIPLTAVFAYRSPTMFAGVLGSLLAGTGYVPLNRTFPVERTRVMFEKSGCTSVVVDSDSVSQLDDLLRTAARPVLVLVPEIDDVTHIRTRWPLHTILGAKDLEPTSAWRVPEVNPDAIAYLLFTSGSTGLPKGVMVAHRNVTAFVDYMAHRYNVTEADRLSQMFDLTFDLSVFDMFIAWERGAWLCCPTQKSLINPAHFIKRNELTVWFSVPSTAVFMKRLGALKPRAFPSLRLSLFCGEPLPLSVASAWAEAAPQAPLENLYGPTELTIACTHYRWDPDRSASESEIGIVPIGHPFPAMEILVVDQNLNEVAPGQPGELLMAGPQVSLGYWNDLDRTAAAFVTPPAHEDVYYRTGDRVRRPLRGAALTHLGRMDSQIKIRGHRVELGEIEATVREACGIDGVVAVAWPVTDQGCDGIEVFVQGEQMEVALLRVAVAETLPDYMVPRRFHFVDQLPLNVNGKFDRHALAERLEEEVRVP